MDEVRAKRFKDLKSKAYTREELLVWAAAGDPEERQFAEVLLAEDSRKAMEGSAEAARNTAEAAKNSAKATRDTAFWTAVVAAFTLLVAIATAVASCR